MRFAKRYRNYLILLFWLVGLGSMFFVTLAADELVVFPDKNLEAVIREEIGQPFKPLHSGGLKKITELDATGKGITSLEGMQYLTNLTVLHLEDNQISDVSPLAGLRKLRTLNLRRNGITDLRKANFEALSAVPLKKLNLDYNVHLAESGQHIWLTDISVLSSFTSLTELTLSQNHVSDIAPLSQLPNIKVLILDRNLITDITPLQGMRFLKTLNLSENNVADIGPLAELWDLQNLYLSSNTQIDTIQPLAKHRQLRILYLDNIPVGKELPMLSNKGSLRELSLASTGITDISPLKSLIHLTNLNLRDNDIVDLTPLSGLRKLEELNIQANLHVQSLAPLSRLTAMKKLDIQDVPVGDQISVLENMDRLEFLDARNCGITDTTVLGSLMARGALQDYEKGDRSAFVDLRDNPLSVTEMDSYHAIRRYWENLDERVPFVLPEFTPLAAPALSKPGGLYTQPFDLVLKTNLPDTAIYYTLDGSEPTIASIQYTGPIAIHNRAGEPDTISRIPEVSPRWIEPAGEVFKATVVRARAINTKTLETSPVVTSTYLVDENKKYKFPVISLTTDARYLFDYETGIYVMGEIYDQWYNPESGLNAWEVQANYNQRGETWERPIHVEYFNTDGVREFSQDASVRIQGAATRERAQKSLRIYAGCDGHCEPAFAYDLFPGLTGTGTGKPIREFTTFLLRNSGNDWEQTMFRDALMQSLVEHTNLDTQAYQPTIVFINGEYWGIHNLRERMDEFYIENHYGIAPEAVVILTENGELSSGTAGDEQHYFDMIAFIESHDMADPSNYAYVNTLMDVDNFIDYQIAEIFFDNTNWPHVNIKYWRKNTAAYQPDAPYGHDGRWRWMVYDTDFGFGLIGRELDVYHDNLTMAIDPNWNDWAGQPFRSLLQNPEFKTKFINRFADHMNTSFERQRVREQIDQMQANLAPEMEEHIRRWRGAGGSMEDWQSQVELLRHFGQYRAEFVTKHISEHFRLSGIVDVHLETDPQMGHIRINTVNIAAGTPGVYNPGSWTGAYFRDVPTEITAVPNPGYRFEKWEGLDGSIAQTQTLTLTLEETVSLKAIFSKE